MGTEKQYDDEFKKQAVKLAREVGNTAAAEELGIPKGTLFTPVKILSFGILRQPVTTANSRYSFVLSETLKTNE